MIFDLTWFACATMNTSCMVPWTLTLDSIDGLADFIEYHSCLLPSSLRTDGAALFDRAALERTDRQAMLTRAREVGRGSWPARQVLKEFVSGPGIAHERQALLKAVRPTTAILLARMGKVDSEASLETLLAHPQAMFAFHEPERVEIQLLLPEIWTQLWREHGPTLLVLQRPFEREAASFVHRLQEERSKPMTFERARGLQQLEDQVFLIGERVDVEAMSIS